VQAEKVFPAGEPLRRAFDETGLFGQLAAGAGAVVLQDADSPVDVESCVEQGGPGPGGQRVELFATIAHRGRDRVEEVGALVKRQLA
jgi:hypothetical protein